MRIDQLGPLQECSLCLEPKPLDDFHRSSRDGRQRWCKACRREYDSAYHSRTKPVRLAQKAEAKIARLAWLYEQKSKPCLDCRRTFHPSAMQFDHLPGCEKVRDVSTLVMRGCMTMARAEILKCDLVCANCHAVRTYLRRLGIEPTQPSICEPPAFYAMSTAPLN